MTATPHTHGDASIDRNGETARVSHDWSGGESLAETIVTTVADLSGAEPDEIERLYDRVDPDSLDALFAPTNGVADRNAGTVSFSLDGYAITVHASGTVVVERAC